MNSTPPLSLLIASAILCAATAFAADPPPRAGMKPLFDGKTLDGWAVKGGTAAYRVEDGAIVGKTVEKSPNTFLCTTRDYGDFDLELDVLCDVQLNSGIQVRSHTYDKDAPMEGKPERTRKAGEVYGYQCEIAEAAKGVSGNFWDEGRRAKWLDDLSGKPDAQKPFKEGQWNHYRIVAQGDRIRSWVNGVAVADFRDDRDKSGFIGLQVHSIKAGSGPFQVRWKNIRIRELESGEKVE